MSEEALAAAILQRLKLLVDPETDTDVVRMRLVEDLHVDAFGKVCYRFRPASFLCPMAVGLAMDIKRAVAAVPGVTYQEITIAGYVMADDLEILINQDI